MYPSTTECTQLVHYEICGDSCSRTILFELRKCATNSVQEMLNVGVLTYIFKLAAGNFTAIWIVVDLRHDAFIRWLELTYLR